MLESYAPPPKPDACYASLKELKYQLNKGTPLSQDVIDFVEKSDPQWMKNFYKSHPGYHSLVVGDVHDVHSAFHSLAADNHPITTHDSMLDTMIKLVGDLDTSHNT